jgi:hypothetical protein
MNEKIKNLLRGFWNITCIAAKFLAGNMIYLFATLLSVLLIISYPNVLVLQTIIWPALITVFVITFKEPLSNFINRIIK